jgi:membrane protease YdiL (CAAX protease family)
MGKIFNETRHEIVKKRFRFIFYEVLTIFFFIFLLLILEWAILPLLIPQSSVFFSMVFYLIRAVVIFGMILLILYIKSKINNRKVKSKEINLHQDQLRLYIITRKNYKYQLLYGLFLLFLVLIPLDFTLYSVVPNLLNFKTISMITYFQNSYLLIANFLPFLMISVIIQFCNVFSEETVFRGLIVKRGSDNFNKKSAIMISTFYFAFNQLFINPLSVDYFSIVIWFIRSLIVGLIFSLTFLRKKWLFPLIFSATINDILSTIIIWNYLIGTNFHFLMVIIYCPLLIVSLILLVIQRSRIKESLQIGRDLIRSYYQIDIPSKEESGDRIFRIIFDIFVGFLLFIIGLLIRV